MKPTDKQGLRKSKQKPPGKQARKGAKRETPRQAGLQRAGQQPLPLAPPQGQDALGATTGARQRTRPTIEQSALGVSRLGGGAVGS